jgi:hypothetical protein
MVISHMHKITPVAAAATALGGGAPAGRRAPSLEAHS